MKTYYILLVAFFLPLFSPAQDLSGLNEIAPYSEGLAAVRKGDQWGFIDKDGKLVIDFRSDLVWQKEADADRNDVAGIRYPRFKNGRCMIKKMLQEEQVPVYGFIDTSGSIVIEPEYLNVTEFDEDYAIGILLAKTFRGENRFQLRIYDYKFSEVILSTSGEVMRLIEQRNNIQMSYKRYSLPMLHSKLIGPGLLAQKSQNNTWEVRKLAL